jgi:hypothetical protein
LNLSTIKLARSRLKPSEAALERYLGQAQKRSAQKHVFVGKEDIQIAGKQNQSLTG